MKFRKLRIPWSMFWGIACLLLIVLWVRSYWVWDLVNATDYSVSSIRGNLSLDKQVAQFPMTGWDSVSLSKDVDEQESDTSPQSDKKTIVTVTTIDVPRIITLPHNCIALFFATLATIPWIPPRFSLRTLLIAITLVAVVLGLIVWSVRAG
jgi:hypothetical protein